MFGIINTGKKGGGEFVTDTPSGTGSSGSGRRTTPRPGFIHIPTGFGQTPDFGSSSEYDSSSSGSSGSSSYESDFSDGFSYFGDQHTDQFRNAQDGGSDGYYYGKTESGKTVYYTGDYRPYTGTGENIDFYKLDEDMAPMDSD